MDVTKSKKRIKMTTPNWDAWQFLIGEWVGEGGGTPGQGSGVLTFRFDLQAQVLIRENHVDFPATSDRPAFTHDDLTVIYPDLSGSMRAIYFDNEGHVIAYAVSSTADTIVLVSEPEPNAPRFRTTYAQQEKGTVFTRFEIAPPGDPDAFALYVEGTSKRKIT
jgi:hypothetical protein